MSAAFDAMGREISKAICCWCRANLVKVNANYFCPQAACNQKQRECAVAIWGKKRGKGGSSHSQVTLYVPTPKQAEFDLRTERYVLFGGAAGPGKSHAARWALYRRCMTIPGFEALLLRRTFPELEKTHLRRMASEAQMLNDLGYGVQFIDSKRLMRFPNGSLIECGHMEDADAVNKYLSTEYDCIVPDEGSQYQPEPLLELSTRARTSKPEVLKAGGAKFWVVTNPGGPSHALLKDLFIDKTPDFDHVPVMRDSYRPEEWAYVRASLDDNPYIDPDYERNLAVLAMTSPFRYEQLRHGDWEATEGAFFGEWRPSVDGRPYHVRRMAA